MDYIKFWNGKKKAITFSFDDGVTQDVRMIKMLDKYNLKATFNINSNALGMKRTLEEQGYLIKHDKNNPEDVREIYKNHEIASHTKDHHNLTLLNTEGILDQVVPDLKKLSDLAGYEVFGFAYPCGGVNNDDRTAEVLKTLTSVKYARTIESTHCFDVPKNMFRFDPTVYFVEDCLFDVVNEFLNSKSDKPQLLYIWGHTYQLDPGIAISWEKFEKLCKLIANRDDIFYGTNREVLLGIDNKGNKIY